MTTAKQNHNVLITCLAYEIYNITVYTEIKAL